MARYGREDRERTRPVMTRLPMDMWEDVHAIAVAEANTMAGVLRRLAKERLDQLRKERGA